MPTNPLAELLALLSGGEDDEPSKPASDPYADIKAANEKVRDAAKWILASFAAIGTVLLGGIQLANVGKLNGDVPNARIWATVVGILLAAVGVGLAIWFTSSVLVPFLNTFRSLDKHPDVTRRVLDDREVIGLTYDELKTEVARSRDAVREAKTTEEYEKALTLWLDWERSKQAAMTVVGSELLADRFRNARTAIIAGVALATVGLGLFAWGANPPTDEKDDPPVTLSEEPVVLDVTLTDSGVTGLKEARGCSTANLRALAIAGETDARELVTVPAGTCQSVRFILTPSVGTAVAATVTERPAGARRLNNGLYSIPVWSVSLPHRLVISNVSFAPDPITPDDKSLRARFIVSDTRGYRVRGASLFVRGLSYGNFAPMTKPERTRNDGVADLTLQPTGQVNFRPNGRVAVFVRASKPGEQTLQGVSVRRLVQFRVAP